MISTEKSMHFLLVEDDIDHAELVMLAMRRNRDANRISHVEDGEAALKFLRRQPPYEDCDSPDMVLLDLNLPRMNGQEVLAEIKQDPSLSSIPVIVLTTSENEPDRIDAYASGTNSYLVKPLDFGDFNDLVGQIDEYWTKWNRLP